MFIEKCEERKFFKESVITMNQLQRVDSHPKQNNFIKRAPFSRLVSRRNTTAPLISQSRSEIIKQRSVTAKPFSDDPEFTSIREKLYIDPDFSEYTLEKLEEFNSYLREYSFNRGMHEDYDEAQRARELSNKVACEISRRNTNTNSNSELTENFENQKNKFASKWDKELNEYDDETAKKRKALQDKLNEEKDKFEDLWRNEMPRKYRKPTPHLLQLKTIEKSYAVSGDFVKAKSVHQEFEKQAKYETESAQLNLIRDYEIAQKKFAEKQKKEIHLFEESRKHHRNCLIAQQENEQNMISNREKIVQKRTVDNQKPKSKLQYLSSAVIYQASKKSDIDDVLLPPLRAPNDPDFKEEKQKKKREMDRVKYEYQKKHAEETLKRYLVDGNISSSRMGNRSRSQLSNKHQKDNDKVVEIKNGIRIVDKKLLVINDQKENTDENNNISVINDKVDMGTETENETNKEINKLENMFGGTSLNNKNQNESIDTSADSDDLNIKEIQIE